MRAVYAARRACLIGAIETELGDFLKAAPGDGGMQMTAYLDDAADDRRAAAAAADADIHVTALSAYHLREPNRKGLYMGFAAVPEARIAKAARRLADALRNASVSLRQA
jgi:GntR family transcriptional regulator/MocR family aminotransferase